MRLRPYLKKDFDTIVNWITDERSHALWCAKLIPYPLEKESFDDLLLQEEQYEDSPFVMTTDDEKVGFNQRTFIENAFTFQDESWGRCNMVIKK